MLASSRWPHPRSLRPAAVRVLLHVPPTVTLEIRRGEPAPLSLVGLSGGAR